MSFYGSTFVFNGIPSEGYDLMLYEVGPIPDTDAPFASMGTIQEEVIGNRWKPYFYGVQQGTKLQFTFTFGVNQERIDAGQFLDRFEIAEIASWLTDRTGYHFLSIDQPDMVDVRYKCMVTALSLVPYGNVPIALRATVQCDSPYAYLHPKTYSFSVTDTRVVSLHNSSSLNSYYWPQMQLTIHGGNSFEIINLSDHGRTLSFTDMPADTGRIMIDNDRQIITCDSGDNLYDCCNLHFFRLKRGMNQIQLTGYGDVTLTCEYPVNVGG